MSTRNPIPAGLVLALLLSALNASPPACSAATTIDATNFCAWAANIGWLNGRGDTNNGAVIGEYVCSGHVYSANTGWINLGSGAPTNGIYYQNLSAGDFGVNQDGLGNLRGYAWGANIGWIAFEDNGAPMVDLSTGRMSGWVWSANCGWICLSNTVACVQTDTIRQGALAPNGLPGAWLLANWGTTNVDANADPDHDGMSNSQEYLAGTNPNDAASNLRITSFHRGLVGDPSRIDLQWTSQPTRYYAIQARTALNAEPGWSDLYVLPWLGANNIAFDDSNGREFYRLRAFRPLMP
jgi:hypothetical protein